MEVFCEYSYDPCEASRVFYTCYINEQNIPENTELKFTGEHKYGNTNNDVAEVNFSSCNITKVPQGLTKVFPNLISLSICGSNLKDLKKNDLAEYKNFEILGFANNCIEFLPGDLFEGFELLNEISFVGNKLQAITPNILDGLNNLKQVDFSNNPKYTKFYSEDPKNLGNGTLQSVKAELREQFCNNSGKPVNVGQRFEDEVQALKITVQNLTQGNGTILKVKAEPPENACSKFKLMQNANQKYEDEIRALKRTVLNLTVENQALKISQAELQHEIQALNAPVIQKGVHSDIKKILQDDNFKDFQIVIDDQKFNVHKFLLTARSPTLADILLNNPHAESLSLVEISVNIFEKILKFLYTDEYPQLEDGKYLHLFSAADRLKIEELKDFAVEKVLEGLNGDNAVEVLGFGNKYAHRQLRLKAFEEIKKKWPRIEFFDDWAFETERVVQVIELYKQKEEALKKMEEKFKDMKANT
ncbi:unnamed protein product [Chironomus riparius]|uniref:BTB domain-containing protein n=1 Tax=Chironomus riparius TaxID=315576 RepID=A0A9N9WMI1_9DIPT|nr:unnamed protein product [Chironomus riparius]